MAGIHTLRLSTHDGERNAFAIVTVTVNPESAPLPSDPATVAPPLDPTMVTSLQVEIEFLYTGANPIQIGVAAGTIDPKHVAVIRGEAGLTHVERHCFGRGATVGPALDALDEGHGRLVRRRAFADPRAASLETLKD